VTTNDRWVISAWRDSLRDCVGFGDSSLPPLCKRTEPSLNLLTTFPVGESSLAPLCRRPVPSLKLLRAFFVGDSSLTYLADGDGDLVKALGLVEDMGFGVGLRSKRFALMVEDGVVTCDSPSLHESALSPLLSPSADPAAGASRWTRGWTSSARPAPSLLQIAKPN